MKPWLSADVVEALGGPRFFKRLKS